MSDAVETKPRKPTLTVSMDDDMKLADEAAQALKEKAATEADVVTAQLARRGGRIRGQPRDQVAAAAAAAAASEAAAAKAGPSRSKFAELSARLSTAADFAAYVSENLTELGRQQAGDRLLNQMLQILSSRPPVVYRQLFDGYRAASLWVLDRIASSVCARRNLRGASGPSPQQQQGHKNNNSNKNNNNNTKAGGNNGNHNANPLDLAYAYEYAIRASQSSMVGPRYTDGVEQLTESTPLPLLSPSELIADVETRDVDAYLTRMVQLAASGPDLVDVAKRLQSSLETKSADEGVTMKPAAASALLGRIISKVRRVYVHEKVEPSTSANPAAHNEETKGNDNEGEQPTAPTAPLLDPVNAQITVSALIAVAADVCLKRRVPVPAKIQHFLDWCTNCDLIGEGELASVEGLLGAVTTGVETQADSMAAVLQLKAASTRAELREAVEAVVATTTEKGEDDEDGVAALKRVRKLKQTTPDIISALGVAGSTLRDALKVEPNEEGEALCVMILEALESAKDSPLPRRAQRFVDDERRRLRQLDPKRPRLPHEEVEQPGVAAPPPVAADAQRRPKQPIDSKRR